MRKYCRMLFILALALSFGLFGCSGPDLTAPKHNNKDHPANHSPKTDKKGSQQDPVSNKIDKMTLDEKIGQMVIVGVDGVQLHSKDESMIRHQHAGGVILFSNNIQNASQTVQMINYMKSANEDADNPLPMFFGVDQEGGSVSRMPETVVSLPSNKKVGKKDDPALSHRLGQLLGKELKTFGFNMDFAPVMDVNSRSGQSVIGDRSFGSDKKLVSKLGIQTMKGIESQSVLSVIKHFPGYGGASTDAHSGLPKVNDNTAELAHKDWVPFQKAIDHGGDAIMVTHMLLPKIDAQYPASMSHKIITGKLRKKLQFHGLVITDDMTMDAVADHYGVAKAAVQSVKAGADIVLVAFHYDEQVRVFHELKRAVKRGEISKKRINQSVRRIIELKQKHRLSNQPAEKGDVDQLNHRIKNVVNEKFNSQTDKDDE